jgi:TolB-like protein/class 3 adenylate cyclase/lipopolysaccharide biosynthesis regulator YciM
MDSGGTRQRLAAIFAADVAGYSRLMGEDEAATLTLLEADRAVFRRWIEADHGRVVDMAGDSVLAVFETAAGAVRAAVAVQSELAARGEAMPEARRMRFRIGVNLGDIIEKEDGTVYGDGVNIAARLQAMAEPGGLCVSAAVNDAVKGKVAVAFDHLGEQRVKNIVEPVRAYRLRREGHPAPGATGGPGRVRARRVLAVAFAAALAVAAAWFVVGPGRLERGAGPAPALRDRTYVAVLPFANLSADPAQEYFSDGITEDVIGWLGRFPELAVISRAAVMQYKGGGVSPRQVAAALGVRYVLEGSVRLAGERVRVTIQLTDADRDVLMWSERYDDESADVFEVQDQITRRVASTISSKLADIERERAFAKPTQSLAAYDHLLRGEEYLGRGSRSANASARAAFEEAIDLDPGYAGAYVGLGFANYNAVISGWEEFVGERLAQAQSLAQQALEMDESNSAAHQLLGLIHLNRRQYEDAARALQRAIAINPSDAVSYANQGTVQLFSGRPQRAIEFLETALRLNPSLGAGSLTNLGLAYYLAGRHGDAVRVLEQAGARTTSYLDRGPHHFRHVGLAASYAELGRLEEARHAAEEVLRVWPFFEVEQFVGQFRGREAQASLTTGLAKAGLE